MKLKLKIVDFNGVYLDKEVDLLNIKTSAGELTILANHLPLITNIDISIMYIKEEEKTTKYSIAGGTLFVSVDDCNILTSAIESEDEIDLSRAKRAYDRAQEKLQKPDNFDVKRAEVALKKALNRLELKHDA